MTVNYLFADKDFNMLSLLDLMEARDLYHVHLMHKQNVVATALGRYLIRKDEPWPNEAKVRTGARQHKGKRTMDNSEVRPYSWPCVVVFVEQWVERDRFGYQSGHVSPEEMVPKAIYMPDGRVVPICVVEAQRDEYVEGEVSNVIFPDTKIGGGFPVIADVQGQEHIASLGCLVTDGHTVYALTNRHVCGEPGEEVFAVLGGQRVRVGRSSHKQLTRKLFEEVYAGWPGKDVYVNLDVGLIKIDNLNCWTAQVYGIGLMGKMADLSINNISLKLIGCPVRAYGCASGQIRGAVHALFYRYKSVGGFEYVADFLVGPQKDRPFSVNPGDSGTVFMLDMGDEKAGLMPISVLWGGHVFVDRTGKTRMPFALATCLSTVCNLLDVDVVRDWNIGQVDYWGEMGHYTIGAKACTVMSEPGLKKLMSANVDRVGFNDAGLKSPEKYEIHKAHYKFVPLADVADNVWRNIRKSDENNHFADMDNPGGPGPYKGKTLLQLSKSEKNISIEVWGKYYDSINETRPGALPFRVWQIYTAMVKSLQEAEPDVVGFFCAAGCLAPYVGDACQPLHISRFHHGIPPVKSGSVAYNVHSSYETDMLNEHAPDVVKGVNARLKGVKATPTFQGGRGAAMRVIQLMAWTVKNIPPKDLVDTYNAGTSPSDRINRIWNAFGDKTMDSMAEGCKCLGEIWESAWAEGGGANMPHTELGAIDPGLLSALYVKPDFLPSRALKDMGPLL
ncbi:MAG TPA: hypothetical protein VFA21_14295 [Pyrinomonadaceae bacterium]|nr:hypothetical protein [Pyrinomonadaceae bacterium]